MARPADQPPALAESPAACPGGQRHLEDTLSTLSLQDRFRPTEGAAAHKLRGQEGKNPFLGLLKEERGQERGARKCFCFIYKERRVQEAPSQGGRAASSPTTSSSKAKPRRGEGNRRGQGTPNTPSDRSHELSPPTLNASTPGTPLGGGRESVHSGGGAGLGTGGNNLSAAAESGRGAGSRLAALVA